MSTRLNDVLNGLEDNYLLPFYWQHGNHTERIPAQIARIFASGCRALCVESRPHPDFGGDGWWRDMDIILRECKSRGMKVWILDDKHFPTGYANGAVGKKHPECRAWELTERHVDVIGPKPNAAFLMNPGTPDNEIVGIFAVRRNGDDEKLTGRAIDLTENAKNGFLYFDVPDGCWRIFYLHKSRAGSKADYVDMISESSSRLMIEEVYQPHFEHYAEYFGNTLAGFFSDEPEFGNTYFGHRRVERGFYDVRIGQDGLALPWSDGVIELMTRELSRNPLPELCQLWYFGDTAPEVRLAYMNAITRLYRKNFCRPIGDWCRAHGVQYIGHIIEDMNNHARLGHGPGHYFRALEGQDMSGIDVVLHQVTPGMAHYMSTATCSGGIVDPAFFHYVLGQLGSSLADLYPGMDGRAMCEVFGAYGWGEGTPMMKWLIDFLLVRGINRFVPHAFSPEFPDPDCPPHFGAEGFDPQFDGFSALMKYTNQAAHLLSGGKHIANVAILYHAEAEWMNERGKAMLTEVPAKLLLDSHISYDIVWEDVLYPAECHGGKLIINGHEFGALIVPTAVYLPDEMTEKLNALASAGFPVLYMGGLPNKTDGETVNADTLIGRIQSLGLCDIEVDGDFPLLRVFRTESDGQTAFMLFNESPYTCETDVKLPAVGQFAELLLLDGCKYNGFTADGTIRINLQPGQSEILIFGDTTAEKLPEKPEYAEFQPISPVFKIEIANSEDLTAFAPYKVTDRLFDMNSPDNVPGFAGKIKYEFEITLPDGFKTAVLDLGQVGENARLSINGTDVGIRIAAPYAFDISEFSHAGINKIQITVSNTLAGKVRDGFSYNLALLPSGMLGPVKISIK